MVEASEEEIQRLKTAIKTVGTNDSNLSPNESDARKYVSEELNLNPHDPSDLTDKLREYEKLKVCHAVKALECEQSIS